MSKLLPMIGVGLLATSAALWGQLPTGTLTGRVVGPDGAGLPGVTVTAESSALQGSRTVVTGTNGDYKVPALPPGDYQVTYALEGFKSAIREMKMSASQNRSIDLALEIGSVAEEIVVVGQSGLISETSTSATTITSEEIDGLPVARDMENMVKLAPGVADTGFFENAPSIGGAPTYENLFLVNGVVINENVRAQILPLFIEDAIQETTTAVSGVSAEYGRFTGGLVNTITKSGGNQFHGSARVSFSNEDWESETPLTTMQDDTTNEVYEGTLGGYFWRDHIWFFGAARDRELSESSQTSITLISFPRTDDEKRYEGKLTITPHPNHTLVGSYLEIERTRTNTTFGQILDLRSVNPPRADPQEIKAAHYSGVLSNDFFLEAQYSERDLGIANGSGGPRDLIEGTLIRSRLGGYRYWAPTFCAECEDEVRNNENLLGKGSYFLSTENAGTHDIVFGYDTFEDIRFAINHQTGSDFTVYGSSEVVDSAGKLVLDPASGSPIPVFNPSASSKPWVRWFAVYNLDIANPTSFKTNSYFVNDRWQIGDKWGVNLGVRYDENDGTDQGGFKVSDDSRYSPRVGVTYDLKGDGDLVLNANYGTYVASLNNSIGDGASRGGAIGDFRWDYAGPPINVNCLATNSCLPPDEVLRLVFAWYTSQGGVFDLSQVNPNAAINQYLNLIDVPGATTQVVDGIKSPYMEEMTVGALKRLGNRGLVRGDLVYRTWDDFYGRRTNLDTGRIPTATGFADVTWLGNYDSGINRDYYGLLTQFRYRINDRLDVAANYTYSEAEGNSLLEGGPTAADEVLTEQYPEYKRAEWNYPSGELRVSQEHKIRAWATYDILSSERHHLRVSWLENFYSGQPYGASRTIDPRSYVTNPGYVTPPSSVDYYFTARDAFTSDDVHSSDIALTYSFSFKVGNHDLEFFLAPQIVNLFDEDAVIDPEGLDGSEGVTLGTRFNPFTTTPVEGTNWTKNATFGRPLNEDDYQVPRTFRFSVGFRF